MEHQDRRIVGPTIDTAVPVIYDGYWLQGVSFETTGSDGYLAIVSDSMMVRCETTTPTVSVVQSSVHDSVMHLPTGGELEASKAVFSSCRIVTGESLTGDLVDTAFFRCDLRQADLRSLHMEGVGFVECVLGRETLTAAQIDECRITR